MKFNSALMTAFGAGSLALLSSAMNPANAASTTFTMDARPDSAPAKVTYTLEDIAGGGVKFTVDASSQLSDIRGVWFDIDNSLLGGLSFIGNDITETRQDGNVGNLGGGANLNGSGQSSFDVGVEIGTSGTGRDDIRMTTFNVFHDSVALSIENFLGNSFATRLTSVEVGNRRNGSSKLNGDAPLTVASNPPSVPEPLPGGMATTMSLLAIGGAFKVMSGKKRAQSQQ